MGEEVFRQGDIGMSMIFGAPHDWALAIRLLLSDAIN
jgi:hypothetical protein